MRLEVFVTEFFNTIDPFRPFKLAEANVGYWIAKLTLPTKRSLCAAPIRAIVRFLLRKQT